MKSFVASRGSTELAEVREADAPVASRREADDHIAEY